MSEPAWEDQLVEVASSVASSIETRTGGRVKAVRLGQPAQEARPFLVTIALVQVPRWARLFWVFDQARRETGSPATVRALDAAWVPMAESIETRRAFLALRALSPEHDDTEVFRFVSALTARGRTAHEERDDARRSRGHR